MNGVKAQLASVRFGLVLGLLAAAATALIERIDASAFNYFIRAHLHAGAIGSIAIGASLVLAFLSVGWPGPRRRPSSWAAS